MGVWGWVGECVLQYKDVTCEGGKRCGGVCEQTIEGMDIMSKGNGMEGGRKEGKVGGREAGKKQWSWMKR